MIFLIAEFRELRKGLKGSVLSFSLRFDSMVLQQLTRIYRYRKNNVLLSSRRSGYINGNVCRQDPNGPLDDVAILYLALYFPSRSYECVGSNVVLFDIRGDNINIMSRFRARQWRLPTSLLRDSLKGPRALFRPTIHGRRFLWVTWKMRLAYYLSLSFSMFLLCKYHGGTAPQYFGTPWGCHCFRAELRAVVIQVFSKPVLCFANLTFVRMRGTTIINRKPLLCMQSLMRQKIFLNISFLSFFALNFMIRFF